MLILDAEVEDLLLAHEDSMNTRTQGKPLQSSRTGSEYTCGPVLVRFIC
jgi:hypothetical protein